MSGTLPIAARAQTLQTCHLDAPTCPFSALQCLATLQTRSQHLVSMPVARSISPSNKVTGDWRWLECRRVGGSGWGGRGGCQSALLAFTGSPRIAKFFSNLQLLDVGANHQRGSPCAYPPNHPLSHHHHQHPSKPPINILPFFIPIHTPHHPPIFSPCRFIHAFSLIHVFIYYFIGCIWAGERRHLVVRTVINSLQLLNLSFLLFFFPSIYLFFSISTREDLFHKHMDLLPLLCWTSFLFTSPSHASFHFPLSILYPIQSPPLLLLFSFLFVSLLRIDMLKDRCSTMSKPSDLSWYLAKINK